MPVRVLLPDGKDGLRSWVLLLAARMPGSYKHSNNGSDPKQPQRTASGLDLNFGLMGLRVYRAS